MRNDIGVRREVDLVEDRAKRRGDDVDECLVEGVASLEVRSIRDAQGELAGVFSLVVSALWHSRLEVLLQGVHGSVERCAIVDSQQVIERVQTVVH